MLALNISTRGVLLLPLVDILSLCTLALIHSYFSPPLLTSYQIAVAVYCLIVLELLGLVEHQVVGKPDQYIHVSFSLGSLIAD
jgi:hypothetical protein